MREDRADEVWERGAVRKVNWSSWLVLSLSSLPDQHPGPAAR
ncbi:MAG TPA: hypothetical protein VK593_05790 [Edaphobacter sp.]|nr:hypothetical protein [Edaphobacter sp.]